MLFFFNNKKNGFFVEFGACDGLGLSNTLILENKFTWNGILAEPDIYFFDSLTQNRKVYCSNLCVYKQSELNLKFHHVVGDSKLSTISNYSRSDIHKNSRIQVEEFNVRTITLNALLDLYSAPYTIEYVSIDTEGSELDIIESFDFESRRILAWTIEHNHNAIIRNKIFNIMQKKGYIRVLEGFSECDDWYIDKKTYDDKLCSLMKSELCHE